MILFYIVTCDAGIEKNYRGAGNNGSNTCPTAQGSSCILNKTSGYGRIHMKCYDLGMGKRRGNWTFSKYYIIRKFLFSNLQHK